MSNSGRQMHKIPITSEFKYQDPNEQDMYLQWILASVIITSPNFAKEIRGSRLNGSVNRAMKVDLHGSCRLQCIEENGCLPCNFEFNDNKKKFTRQLCKSHRFFGLQHFTEGP